MTDNEKMLRTAYQYSKKGLIGLAWICSLPKRRKCRAELREYWVIFAAVIQKFFSQNFKFTEHLNITLGIISHSLSTLLIFFISSYFLPDYIALLLSIIYLSSSWSTEVILYLSHIIYSQVWFLISLGFLLFAYIFQEYLYIFFFLSLSLALLINMFYSF